MAPTVNPPARVVLLSLALLGLVLLASGQAFAQPAAPQGQELDRLWADMIHGIRVAQPELARSNAQAILDSSAPPRNLYELYTQTENADQVLTRGEGLEGMPGLIADIRRVIEQGYQAMRSDPQEIARALEMLPTSPRAYQLAANRLATSGEYAMPQLIQALTDPQTPARTKEAIITVLPRLGRSIVKPLTMVLQSDDAQLLQTAATTLGQLQYPEAAPFLKELIERPGVLGRTQDAARAALLAVAGQAAAQSSVALLFHDQAVKQYYNEPSISPEPDAPTGNVWYWRQGLGLDFVPVPREIYGDIYAMRLSRKALEHDPRMYPAVSLWLAASLRKSIQLPKGMVDPTAAPDAPSAEFHALAAGASFMQDVLARALRDGDARLATLAIGGLSRTAGAKSLVQEVAGGVQPLVAALGNTDRQVRYMAALTLAGALPAESFQGQDQVVRVLGEMLRITAGRRALLSVEDRQLANQLKDILRAAGFEVVDEPVVESAITAATRSGGVDLIVLSSAPAPAAALARLRQEPLLAATAVLVVKPGPMAGSLATMEQVTVLPQDELDPRAVAAAVAAAGQAGGEGIDPESAANWTLQAADAVWLLGMTNNPVLDVSYARGPLVDLLGDERPEVQMSAGRALSVMKSDAAQQALAKLALDEQAPPEMRLAVMSLLVDSVRRFGNLLSADQAQQVVALVVNDTPTPLREAAAAVLGSLNLPSDQIKALILQTGREK